jgi:hypothetical protein
MEDNPFLSQKAIDNLRASMSENDFHRQYLNSFLKEDSPTYKLAVAGAAWWRAQLTEKPEKEKFNNGDGFTSGIARMLSAGQDKPQLLDVQLQYFEKVLTSRLCKAMAESQRATVLCFGVDYGPDEILADAAAEAGILHADWPWKTLMWLRFGQEKYIEVSEGYGRPRLRLEV